MNTITAKYLTAATQAPDAESGPAAAADTEVKRSVVAKHELLDSAGNVVEKEEEATGIRYTLLANNQSVDLQTGGKPGDLITMLAVFGGKTLATNVSSAERNNSKGEASPDEQIAAVRERFQLLATGTWVDRTREGVGAKIDKDALAEAISQVLITAGKKTADEIAQGYKATIRQKLEDDANYVRTSRQVPAVATAYAQIVGRVTKTVDDLAI